MMMIVTDVVVVMMIVTDGYGCGLDPLEVNDANRQSLR